MPDDRPDRGPQPEGRSADHDEPTALDPANPTGADRAAEEASTLADGHGAGGPVTGDAQAGQDAGGGSKSRAQHPRGGDPNRARGGDDI